MEKNLYIDASHPNETRVVLKSGENIEDYEHESLNNNLIKNNIYLGKVSRVEPSLQAAFVDFGRDRHGFLSFNDIQSDYYQIPKADLDKIKKNFTSEMLDEKETVEMIKTINDEHQMVVDPHTAVGIGAVRKLRLDKNCVVLSTAHPCKFPKAIEDAISKTENLPESLKYVNDRKEKFELLSNDIEKVKKYVMNSI